MERKIINKLINQSKEITNKNFYCKHSNFRVGGAFLTKDGKVYKRFNVENDGNQSICAKKVAFTKALSDGNKELTYFVVEEKPFIQEYFKKTLSWDYCRKFLSNYTLKDFMIYTCADVENKLYSYKLEDLLPESFSL